MKLRQVRKPPRDQIDGVLLLHKPRGLTSNAALQTARRLLNAAKAGHTGTLDPMATGLLPLTFGEATKFSQMLLHADKCYEAVLQLGVETDTGDADGEVTATAAVNVEIVDIEDALSALRGEIDQIPPMYSALKRDGKPLYEYARAGIELALEPRRVTVHSLELAELEQDRLRLRVHCSKGTYVRSLAIDLGRALKCGAHLTALCRTEIGPFTLDRAITLDEIEAVPLIARSELLAPVDALVAHLPALPLDEEESLGILQGRVLGHDDGVTGLARLYAGDRFIGLGVCHEDGTLTAKRLIATKA